MDVLRSCGSPWHFLHHIHMFGLQYTLHIPRSDSVNAKVESESTEWTNRSKFRIQLQEITYLYEQ